MEPSLASVLAAPDPSGPGFDRAALARVWPLFALTVSTPRLVLRVPTDADLVRLANVAADIHAPGARPLTAPWTDRQGIDREQALLQHHWEARASWSPARWSLDLAVWHEGELVGVQTVRAHDFAVRRTVQTASWLHRSRQGAGIGTEMRRAALHLAFAGLGAGRAETEAHESTWRRSRSPTGSATAPTGTTCGSTPTAGGGCCASSSTSTTGRQTSGPTW